jgi:hypothetical protein
MKKGISISLALASMTLWAAVAAGQQKAENPVHLELTAEVAATTPDGDPSVFRITLKNAGDVAVDMPMPELPCTAGGGGIEPHSKRPDEQIGSGWGCGRSEFPSLMIRVKHEWIRLQPGEFITLSDKIRVNFHDLKPGIFEYWFEYCPPEASPEELVELQRSGYVVPTERIKSAHMKFAVH